MHLLHALPGAVPGRGPLPAQHPAAPEAAEAGRDERAAPARRQGAAEDHHNPDRGLDGGGRADRGTRAMTEEKSMSSDQEGRTVNRRALLGTTAAAGLAGAAAGGAAVSGL